MEDEQYSQNFKEVIYDTLKIRHLLVLTKSCFHCQHVHFYDKKSRIHKVQLASELDMMR